MYILPDQFRAQAIGVWGSPGFRDRFRGVCDPVETPNLNALAKQSTLFSQACSTYPLCSPHRAMLMSGMFPRHNGVPYTNCRSDRPEVGMKHSFECFTDVLNRQGYETAYVGKTHWERTEALFDQDASYVGTKGASGGCFANEYDTYVPPGPGRRGNQYWFQNIGDVHKDAISYSNEPSLIQGKADGEPHRHRRFTPEMEADIVVDYLRNKDGQRSESRPFSLIWSPNPPHNPYTDVDRDCDRAVYETYYRDMAVGDALNRPNVRPTEDDVAERAARIYFTLVTSIDQQVGRVLEALEQTGQAENTIVVFTSDHGEMLGSHGQMGKGDIYDESFLVPLMIRFPGVLKPCVEDLMIGTVDLMPTLLDLIGLAVHIPHTAQGTSFAQVLRSGDCDAVSRPASALYLNGPRRKGVRTDRYTYVVDLDDGINLFDQDADPYQTEKLSPDDIDPADWDFLRRELGRWLERAEDEWAERKTRQEWVSYPEMSA
ncbi:MAG: sulfatase [Planctomycetota bacterium]